MEKEQSDLNAYYKNYNNNLSGTYESVPIYILGFASKEGKKSENEDLSDARAIAVEKYLLKKNKSLNTIAGGYGVPAVGVPEGSINNEKENRSVFITIDKEKAEKTANIAQSEDLIS